MPRPLLASRDDPGENDLCHAEGYRRMAQMSTARFCSASAAPEEGLEQGAAGSRHSGAASTSTRIGRPIVEQMREAAIVASSFALCVLGRVLQVDGTLGAPPATVYAIAVVSAGVLPLRRRAPATALALTMACGLVVAPL